MSRSYSANLDGVRTESHEPDSGQLKKSSSETTTDSHATKIKDEASLTASERIDFWYTKIEEPGGHHEEVENNAQYGSGLSEEGKLTPLHEILEKMEGDDDGSDELEKLLGQWKNIINVRSPEDQETALHMAIRKGFNKMACQLLTAGAKVDIENGSGELPLQLACEHGNQQLVEKLLQMGANPERMDASGVYPLHSVVVRHFEAKVVRDLLSLGGSVINKTVDSAQWTPLNKAIYYGCEDVVDVLLEGGASLYIRDSDGWTPLTTAIKKGLHDTFHKLLSHLERDPTGRDVVNIPDNFGMTPLMQLSANPPGDLVKRAIERLLWMGPDVDATDKEGKTALHHAMASASRMHTEPDTDLALKLVHSLSVKRLLHSDRHGETAFDVAFEKHENSIIPAFEPLLTSLVDRLAEDESIENLFCWAAYRLERHTFARRLLQKRFAAKIPKDLRHDQWGIVEWAIFARMPRLLLTYLRTLSLEERVNEDYRVDKSISDGWKLLEILKEKARQSSTSLGDGRRQNREHGPTSGADLRNLEDILDCLYLERVEKPTKPLELSKPKQSMASSLKRFRAAIMQSRFVKFRTIQELLYDVDSMERIQENAKMFEQFEYTPNILSEPASQTSDEFQSNTKTSAQFTWIHLPATNMVWMEDTLKMILKIEGCDESEAEKVVSFLRGSWTEIPDRTSSSRFMKPLYVYKKADNATEDESELEYLSEQESSQTGIHGSVHTVSTDRGEAEKNKSFAVSAIYMPYLYFSTYHESESGEQMTCPEDFEEKLQVEIRMRQALFKEYEDSVVHQPPTLDEFHYQFSSDKDAVEDRNKRNKDQVVTKYLLREDLEKQRSWPLLRVGQLWVWTIDEKWLITSTSCATNDIRDNLVTDTLEHVRGQVQNGIRGSEPTSATEMSKVIVDYCIGAYDREQRHQRRVRSIHQIFSDSINEIGRQEPRLFRLSHDSHDHGREAEHNPDADHTSETMVDLQAALKAVADQLYRIRDVRDELNILMSITRFQRRVQTTMDRNHAIENCSSGHLLREIHDLVKATITLQESDIASFQAQIANWQASESVKQVMESVKQGKQAVKQGKIVLVFTLVTVWFLPLSFLTSLFALDVSSFLETPAWAFCVLFIVPLIFLGSAVVYVWKAEIRGYVANFGTPAPGSGNKGAEGTSTSRLIAVKGALRKRKGIDVEHGER